MDNKGAVQSVSKQLSIVYDITEEPEEELIATEFIPEWSQYDSNSYWLNGCKVVFSSTYHNSISVNYYSLTINGYTRKQYFITPEEITPGESTIDFYLTGLYPYIYTGSYPLTIEFSYYSPDIPDHSFTNTVSTP